MSLNAHLTVLQQRHNALDNEIAAARQSKPAMSDADLKEMKLKKLHLKQEIERLSAH